jgi:predicted nuclease with TOPRIM domain
MFVQIKDKKNLVRDTTSRALMNTDREEFEAYYAERDQKIKELQEKQSLENKVNKLEEDMSEIKDLLRQLVTRT